MKGLPKVHGEDDVLARGRRTKDSRTAQRVIEAMEVRLPGGEFQHASIALFQELVRMGMDGAGIGAGLHGEKEDYDKFKAESKTEEGRWRFEFRLREQALRMACIKIAMDRQLGKAKISIDLRASGNVTLDTALRRVLDSAKVKEMSKLTMGRSANVKGPRPKSAKPRP